MDTLISIIELMAIDANQFLRWKMSDLFSGGITMNFVKWSTLVQVFCGTDRPDRRVATINFGSNGPLHQWVHPKLVVSIFNILPEFRC